MNKIKNSSPLLLKPSNKKDTSSIIVSALKYDGREHRRWGANLVYYDESFIVLDAIFNEEVRHDLLGILVVGTQSLEYYWFNRWYNIFRFAQPDGTLRNYYCNINIPPVFDGHLISYVDLEIDILVAPDLSYRIVDQDEFEINAIRFNYPVDLRRHVQKALHELVTLIESHQFPFQKLG